MEQNQQYELEQNAISLEVQINVLYEMVKKMLNEKIIRKRTIKYKLQDYINSDDVYKRLYALNKIVTDGKGVEIVPNHKDAFDILEDTNKHIADILAKRYIQNNIEKQVEKNLIEKQNKYMDEIRLGIIKNQKGSENSSTLKKYNRLEMLDKKKLTKSIQSLLRPEEFPEIVGQE